MRILFVINNFSYGGAEKLVFDLSKTICPMCDQVSVAALYRMDNEMEEKIKFNLEQAGVKTYILDKKAGSDRFATVRKLCKIVKEDNIHLIHAHCSVPMLMGKLAGYFAGVKVVCTIHSTKGYNAMQEKLTSWMTHSYVSIGQAAEDYMLNDLGIASNKITRIYNAVDVKRYCAKEHTEYFWNEWGFDAKLPVVLNVGRVVPVKNQICLLRAVAKCCRAGKPVQCVILGGYEENSETYTALQEYIRGHSLEKYVRLLGQRDDVPLFLQNCDCFVMTSIYEGLSVAYLEAVLSAKPVVVTDMPFARELQQLGSSATIIAQDDSDALADVLMEKRYVAASEEIRLRFSEMFSIDKFADLHMKLYRQIIGG